MRVNVPGVGAVNFPDTMSPDEIKLAIERDILPKAKKQPDPISKAEAGRMALEGTSAVERGLINFGAGVDAAIEGVKQLFGRGPSEAQIQEKRELDKAAADSMFGGGALQLAGEFLPTAVIPGSGFVKGAQAAMKIAPTAARLGTKAAVADSAIGGAISGAMQLTSEDESRLFNTLAGAVGGSAVTGLLASGRTVRELLTRGGAEAKAAQRLVDAAGGPEAAEIALAQMRSHMPGPVTRDIPMSAAEITQNPGLGRAERSAQARYTEDWAPFRQEQAAARWDALKRATANDLEGVTKARKDATKPLRTEALDAASRDKWFHAPIIEKLADMRAGAAGADPAVQRLLSYVEGQVETKLPRQAIDEPAIFRTLDKAIAESPQPNLFSTVEQVAAELPNHGYRSPRPGSKMFYGDEGGIIGGDFAARHVPVPTSPAPITDASPERLYRVRKVLLEKLNGKAQLGDELSAAAKSRREETMQIVNSIDDALNRASDGKWGAYLKEYAGKSGEVNSAEALTLIRKGFEKDSAPQFGGVPAVTGHRLGAAIEKHGKNSFGDKLTTDARAGLRELQDNVAMSEGLQKLLKLTGTSGGGSNTAMDLTSIAAQKVPVISEALPFIGKFAQRSDEMTQAAMSDALRNPDLFIASVSKKLKQNRPLTRSEESVLQLLRSAGAASALELAAPQ